MAQYTVRLKNQQTGKIEKAVIEASNDREATRLVASEGSAQIESMNLLCERCNCITRHGFDPGAMGSAQTLSIFLMFPIAIALVVLIEKTGLGAAMPGNSGKFGVIVVFGIGYAVASAVVNATLRLTTSWICEACKRRWQEPPEQASRGNAGPSKAGAIAAYHRAIQTGDSADAIEYFDRFLKEFPDDAEVLNALGQLKLDDGDLEGALPATTRAVELNRCAENLNNLARVERERGHGSAALALFEEATKLDPENRDVKFNLMLCARGEGDRERAKVLLSELEESMPDHPFVQMHLAECCEEGGDSSKARRHLEHAIAVQPDFLDARVKLVQLLCEAGQHRKYKRHLKELKKAGLAVDDTVSGELVRIAVDGKVLYEGASPR